MSEEAKPLSLFIDPDQLKKDLAFNELDINNAFLNQASLYLHYATLAQRAQFQAESCKAALELIEAKLSNEIREEATCSKSKLTEKQIENRIRTDSRYVARQKRYLTARRIAGSCKVASEAFIQRRDMLVQAAKSVLEERKGELRLTRAEELGDRAKRAISGH